MKKLILIIILLFTFTSTANASITISGTGTINKFIIDNKVIPIKELRSRTVIVYQRNEEGKTWISAGVSINKRQVLTVYHAVIKKDIYVDQGNGKAYIAHIIKTDEAHDLALIDIGNGPDMIDTALPLGEPEGALITIGHPQGELYVTSTGSRGSIKQDGYLVPIKITVDNGNSGGGVMNEKGELVGLIESALNAVKDAAFMVGKEDIQNFLK